MGKIIDKGLKRPDSEIPLGGPSAFSPGAFKAYGDASRNATDGTTRPPSGTTSADTTQPMDDVEIANQKAMSDAVEAAHREKFRKKDGST